jgi:hypothetical protein
MYYQVFQIFIVLRGFNLIQQLLLSNTKEKLNVIKILFGRCSYLCFFPVWVVKLPRPKSFFMDDGHEFCTSLSSFENKNLFPSGASKDTAGENRRFVLNTCNNLRNSSQFLQLVSKFMLHNSFDSQPLHRIKSN